MSQIVLRLLGSPHAPCQTPLVSGWVGVDGARPPEHLRQQRGDEFHLVGAFDLAVDPRRVVRFIPHVPSQHAVVVAELGHHPDDVVVQHPSVPAVGEVVGAGTLHPARVVHSGPRRALTAESGVRIPAGIEQDEQRLDAVMRCDVDELGEAELKALPILNPQLIVKEHPHRVEPDQSSHPKLLVDEARVVRAGLEHLQLVDGVRRDEVGADEPILTPVPPVCAIRRPAAGLTVGQGRRRQGRRRRHQKRHFERGSPMDELSAVGGRSMLGLAKQIAVLRHSNLSVVIRRRTCAAQPRGRCS